MFSIFSCFSVEMCCFVDFSDFSVIRFCFFIGLLSLICWPCGSLSSFFFFHCCDFRRRACVILQEGLLRVLCCVLGKLLREWGAGDPCSESSETWCSNWKRRIVNSCLARSTCTQARPPGLQAKTNIFNWCFARSTCWQARSPGLQPKRIFSTDASHRISRRRLGT